MLAQAVLRGKTRGYRHHPQLERFKLHSNPLRAIGCFLLGVYNESLARGYHFDASKIDNSMAGVYISENAGQLLWEWEHLKAKLRKRAPEVYDSLAEVRIPEPHPMFQIVAGPVQPWERAMVKYGKRRADYV